MRIFVVIWLCLGVMAGVPNPVAPANSPNSRQQHNSRSTAPRSVLSQFFNNAPASNPPPRSRPKRKPSSAAPPINQVQPPLSTENQRDSPWNAKFSKSRVRGLLGPGELWSWPKCTTYWPKLPQHLNLPFRKHELNDYATNTDLKTIAMSFFIPFTDLDETQNHTHFREKLIRRILKAPQQYSMCESLLQYQTALRAEQQRDHDRNDDRDISASNNRRNRSNSNNSNSTNVHGHIHDISDDNDTNNNRNNNRRSRDNNDSNNNRDSDRSANNQHINPLRSNDTNHSNNNLRDDNSNGDNNDNNGNNNNFDPIRPHDDESQHEERHDGSLDLQGILSGFTTWQGLDSISIKITGDDKEDLVKKLGKLNFYAESTQKKKKTLWIWLTNSCLEGRAAMAFRTAYRSTPDTVNTFDKVLKFLFLTFQGNETITAKKLIFETTRQKYLETPKQYFTRFDIAVKTYLEAVAFAQALLGPNDDEIHHIPNAKKIFTRFVNSLQLSTQREVRNYYNFNGLTGNYDDALTLVQAIEFAEKQLNPPSDIKLKGAYNQQVRKRKLQRIEEQQHEYYAEYDGTRQNRKRTKGNDGKGFYPQRRGRGSRGRGFYRGRGGYRGRGNFRGRGRPYPSYGGYRGRNNYRGRGRGNFQNYRGRGRGNYSNNSQQRNQQILPRPSSQTKQGVCWNCNKTGHMKKDCPSLTKNSNSGGKRGQRSVHLLEQEEVNPNDMNFSDMFPLAAIDGLETANIEPLLSCEVDLYVHFEGGIQEVTALLDCGASVSVVDHKFVDDHNLEIFSDYRGFNCRTANGRTVIKEYVNLHVVDQDYEGDPRAREFHNKFYILRDLPHSVLIGRPLMRKLRYRIVKLERETFEHEGKAPYCLDDRDNTFWDKLLAVPSTKQQQQVAAYQQELEFIDHHILAVQTLDVFPNPLDIDKIRSHEGQKAFSLLSVDINTTWSTEPVIGNITDNSIETEFKQLLRDYDGVLAKHWADCGLIEGVTLKLDLFPQTTPFKKPLYPMTYKMQDEWARQRAELLKPGFIVESNSEFASPSSFTPKRQINGKVKEWRFFVDYRELNKHTIPDRYPIPNISDIQRKFVGAVLFSSLDLRHGYHHIAIAPEDRHKTAFITPDGLYEWTRMGFGFKNAPSCFQRAMDVIFRDIPGVIVYIDDILVCATTEREMMDRLRLVFEKLSTFNMKLRMDKCKFFCTELRYLGHIISAEGTKPDPDYVKRILELQKPAKNQIGRFIGMVQWLGKFIPNLAKKLEPITRLRRKGEKYQWGAEQEKAFDDIKAAVQKTPILKHPDLTKPFVVVCDASDFAVGAVLLQNYSKIHHPVEFFSRLLDKCQKNWHISEKEVASIVWSCEKWEKYLLPAKFDIFTDHRNLIELLNYETDKVKRSKLTRWLLRLQMFTFTAHYITGIENQVADYLSRDVYPERAKIIDGEQFAVQLKGELFVVTFVDKEHHITNLDAIIDRSVRLHQEKQRQNKVKRLSRADKADKGLSNGQQQQHRKVAQKCLSRGVKQLTEHRDIYNDSDGEGDDERSDSDDDTDSSEDDAEYYDKTADILSKRANWTDIIDLAAIQRRQRSDPIFQPIIEALTTNNRTSIKLLPKYAQKQYRKSRFMMGKNGLLRLRTAEQQILIPPRFRDQIMRYFHTNYSGAHQAARRIYKTMKQYVAWFGMLADVKQYVNYCRTCKLAKTNPSKRAGYLQLFTPKAPYEMVAIDLVGPLPVTAKGNKYILTAIDRFSRFLRLMPVQSITGENIAVEFRANWILKHGTPKQILSDRGAQFTGYIFQILCRLFGIEKVFSSSYHPQTNGMIERAHRFIKERLRCIAYTQNLDYMKGDDWDIYLPEIEFAYNNTKNEMTGTAPYEVVYGHLLRTPTDNILKQTVHDAVADIADVINEDEADKPLKLSQKVQSYVKLMEKHRSVLVEEMKANMKRYDTQRKRYFDKHRAAPIKYEFGDKVVVDTKASKVGNKAKLNINRKQAVILDKLNDNAYVVRYDSGEKEAVNIKRIFRFEPPQQQETRNTTNNRKQRRVVVLRKNLK